MGPEKLETLRRLSEFTLKYNRKVNLTADKDPAHYLDRHIDDGVAAGHAVKQLIQDEPRPFRVMDVGSGNGVPGLVWSVIWGHARICLLEAKYKKSVFLEEAVAYLGLTNVDVLWGRAEEYARKPEFREQFDLVVARALAPMPVLLEWTLPFTRLQGHVAAIKSRGNESEIRDSKRALKILGSDAASCQALDYATPAGFESRVYMVMKCRPTPDEYPRAPGGPSKSPLI